jgi:hypothetical protein
MSEQGLLCGYAPPRVVDYGTLVEITAAVHLLMGATDISDLSFSGPLIPGGGGETAGGTSSGSGGGEYGILNGSGGGGSDPSSGVGSGGGGGGASGSGSGGGGGGGGGGHLPFTGFAAGAAVAIGSGLTAAGAALRRAARRRPRP